MRVRWLLLGVLAGVLLLVGQGAWAQEAQVPAPAEGYTLVILHTNDVHARIEQFNKYGGTCKPDDAQEGKCFGGVARRMTKIREIREQEPNVLLLDAGDEFLGTLFFYYYQGQATAEFMNRLGYDAMTFGNHEFDSGPETLGKFLDAIEFPMVSSNVDVSEEPALQGKVKPYVILEVGGRKIGLVGATTTDTPILSSPGDKVKFLPVVESVQKAVDELTAQGVDIVIMLSHLGYSVDKEVAAQLKGVDVIVGGHSHTFLSNTSDKAKGPYPTVVEGADGQKVLIVQDGSYAKYLGYLKVTFDAQGVAIAWEGEPILLDASVPEDEEILARVQELAKPVEELRNQVIGEAAVDLDGERASCRFYECTMGNLVTDAMLWATEKQGVQIALQNGGGIRASIPAGPVTLGQVIEVLPFGNTLATFEIEGKYLLQALENGVSRAHDPEAEGTGRFLQVAGLRYTWDPTKPVGERIVSVEVRTADGGWEPLQMDKVYKVVTNNYIRNGGDDYEVFKEHAIDPYDFGPVLDEVVADYIKTFSPVKAEIEGRIQRVEGAAEPTEAATEQPTEAPTEAPTEVPTAEPTEAPTEAPAEQPTAAPVATEAPAETGGGVSAWVWVAVLVLLLIGLGIYHRSRR